MARRLLGLIGEQVSDLTYVQPEQICPLLFNLLERRFWMRSFRLKRGSSS